MPTSRWNLQDARVNEGNFKQLNNDFQVLPYIALRHEQAQKVILTFVKKFKPKATLN